MKEIGCEKILPLTFEKHNCLTILKLQIASLTAVGQINEQGSSSYRNNIALLV